MGNPLTRKLIDTYLRSGFDGNGKTNNKCVRLKLVKEPHEQKAQKGPNKIGRKTC